jgi:ubiquinone/menaquinone biosynthesis C-methylase UbiE
MAWYDVFSRFYDASLEPHYREQRMLAAGALQLGPGQSILDVPCGTGQSFGPLIEGIGPTGMLVGVDRSAGMVREARRRIAKRQLAGAVALLGSASSVSPSELGREQFDRVHVFLGMTVFDDPEAVFTHLWSLLAPRGWMVLVDVYNPKPGLQGRMVEWLAQADLTRRWWEPLERCAEQFERRQLPSQPLHGGDIWLALGRKPS